MQAKEQHSRRNFMRLLASTSGGLFLGFNWADQTNDPKVVDAKTIANGIIEFNSYLSIGTDNRVIIYSPNPEVGQGIKTAFPIVVAEELDADWKTIEVIQAALDSKKFERQVAGGSGSIPHSWERLRKAGASARYLLLAAASQQWKVPVGECSTARGTVYHKASGRSANYGSLATAASALALPKDIPLKSEKDFTLIGQTIKNVDNQGIITGKPLFGIDFYREGMLFAVIERPKVFGSKIKSLQADVARNMPGVVDIVTFDEKVAVVAKSTWQAQKAREKLVIEYDKVGTNESSSDHDRIFKELLDSQQATVRRKDGDVDLAFKTAAKIIKAEYQCPFLAHSPLEPMNFFAHVKDDSVELIGSTQRPEGARAEVAKLLGIAPEKISVEITRMGGGFGRRLASDFVLDAVQVSKLMKAPIKVIWMREDDIQGGIYRPAVRYRFEAALDKTGTLIGYKLRGAGINAGNTTREHNFPSAAVPHLLIDSVEHQSSITTGPWRAPITNFLAYAEQSFLEEVAEAAGKDPVKFRLELLERAKNNPVGDVKYDVDRMIGVIQLAAEKSKWGKKKGVFQGFSVYYSHLSYVAQVGEVVMEKGKPVLKNIVAAVDCGIIINQSGALQQTMGGIVDGMGHAMYGALTFTNGATDQQNFDGFRLIRMNEVPNIEVHFVDNGISPTGLGEPALPPTGAAIANAFYKATKKRFRDQPFVKEESYKHILS